jgi:hypothetical protein
MSSSNPTYEYFTVDKELNRGKCLTCSRSIFLNSTNLEKHLQSHKTMTDAHEKIKKWKAVRCEEQTRKRNALASTSTEEPRSKVPMRQISFTESMSRKSSTWAATDRQQVDGERSVALMVLEDAVPFRIVERPGFQRLCTQLQPKFKIPERRQVHSSCFKLVDEIREKVKLAAHTSLAYSLTCDLWSSKTLSPMLGVTLHYITAEYHLKGAVLTTEPFNHPHTGLRIREAVEQVVERMLTVTATGYFSISITTDNASNNKKAWPEDCVTFDEGEDDDLELELEKDEEYEDNGSTVVTYIDQEDDADNDIHAAFVETKLIRKGCVNHKLHLVITAAVLETGIVVKARKLAVAIRKSGNVRQLVRGAGATVVPSVDCKTRWDGILCMLRSLLRIMPAIDTCIENGADFHPGLSTSEKTQLRQLVDLLADFELVTKLFSSESKVTISLVIPSVLRLIAHVKEKHTLGIKAITRNILAGLHKRFACVLDVNDDDFDPTYAASTLLDPRTTLALSDQLRSAGEKYMKQLQQQKYR